jgi:lipoprotein-releasing system ATP-binding protein
VSTHSVLEVRDLRRIYGPPQRPLVVLDGVDFQIDAGERMAITGPSGSGKSTLLHCVGLLDTPDSGTIRIQGVDTTGLPEKALARMRADTVGVVFQAHHLLPQCTAWENLLIPIGASTRGRPGEDPLARAERLLQRVGLADRRNHRPGELSGGECQRIALVRAMVNQPAILLADEPTGALDRPNADAMVELLMEVAREESTAMVVITHSDAVARRIGGIHRLESGRLVPESV